MEYHSWINSNGKPEMFPMELLELDNRNNYFQLVFGTVFHALLFVFIVAFKSMGLWPCVAVLCKIRIATDRWSIETRQCGYNRAQTYLGLSRLKKKDVEAAISALNESWQVYPCPHNTTFGLMLSLAKALEPFEEARSSVENYKQIHRAFRQK